MANSNGVESQIVDYIIQAQKHGLSDTEIKQNLLNAGWEGSTVEANFVFAKASENKPQAIGSRPQVAPQEGKIIPDTSAKPKIEPQPQPQAQPVEGKIIPDKKPAPAQQQTAQAMPAPTQPSVSSTTESAAPIALPAPHSHKKLALGALVFLLLACAGGAYAYYEYYYNRIEGVWKRLQTAAPEAAKIYKTKYEFSYEFTYKDDFDDPSEKEKPGGLGLSGELYKDFTVENEPKLSNELNVSLKSDSESFNFGISFMFLNKIFYLDLGRVQFLKSILPGQDLGWIKLDPESLMKYLEEKGIPVDDYKQFSEQVSPNSTDSLIFQKLVKVGVIQSGDFLAKEDLNDIAVYHFKNSFDKAAFLPLFFEAINKKMAESN